MLVHLRMHTKIKSVACIASVDVERHARDFMEAAKKLQLYFLGLQREDQPTKAELLQRVNQDYIWDWTGYNLLKFQSNTARTI